MILKSKTVHIYDFDIVKEIVIYDDSEILTDGEIHLTRSPGRTGNASTDVSERNRGIAIARAKKTLRRVALFNKLDRLMTITTRENIQDYEYMDKLFKKFVFNLRQIYPDFKYIGTRERQVRGAVHYHLLINRYIPQSVAYQIWLDLVPSGGTVDFRKKEGLKAINYCLKYVSECMSVPFVSKKGFNAKAYLCSTNLNRQFKACRKVVKYYVEQLQQDYVEFNQLVSSMLTSAKKIFFDKSFSFDVSGIPCSTRNVLLEPTSQSSFNRLLSSVSLFAPVPLPREIPYILNQMDFIFG